MLYNIFWRLANINNCYYLCHRVGYHRNGEDRRCNVTQRSAGVNHQTWLEGLAALLHGAGAKLLIIKQ